MSNSTSITYDMPPEGLKRLQALRAECQLPDDAALFNNALCLLQWAVAERRAGRIIGSVDEKAGVYQEYLAPELAAVAPR